MDAADLLGQALAKGTTAERQTISGQVVDVTDTGTVNLDIEGTLIIDVPCADSYRNRAAGDWVAVQLGARPIVKWRLGADQAAADQAAMQAIAEDVALDAQIVRAATWGTAGPSGSGWQQVQTLYLRKNSAGKVELYGQLASETDPPPPPPPTRPPRPVSISPSDAGTWRGGRPDEYAASPTQGDWTGRGDRRGGWFYGTSIAAACSGKTVSKMTVAFTRKRGSGVNARRPMHLYLHDYTVAPSGQLNLADGPEELLSLSVGATGTATLPASWRSQLASGAARGLAIYSRGSRDYMSVTGGRITITFSA
ncbi:hypothetical protein [Streptomyces youssoufiensis]